jgi:hypothetical protein
VFADRFALDAGVGAVAAHWGERCGAYGTARGHMDAHGSTLDLIENGAGIARAYGVRSLSTVLLVGPDGIIMRRGSRFRPGDVRRFAR